MALKLRVRECGRQRAYPGHRSILKGIVDFHPVIGVISKVDQREALEEFFELFKTPWETFVPGRKYDTILSTTDEVPLGEAKLVISFGASPRSGDSSIGITAMQHRKKGPIKYKGASVPVYGECALLETEAESTVLLSGAQGTVGIRRSLANGAAVIRLNVPAVDGLSWSR